MTNHNQKFIATMMAMICSAFLAWQGVISGEVWVGFAGGALGIFTTGNVLAKKVTKNGGTK